MHFSQPASKDALAPGSESVCLEMQSTPHEQTDVTQHGDQTQPGLRLLQAGREVVTTAHGLGSQHFALGNGRGHRPAEEAGTWAG